MALSVARLCKLEAEDCASGDCSVLLSADVSDAMLGSLSCSRCVCSTSSENVKAQVRMRNVCSWCVSFAKSQDLRIVFIPDGDAWGSPNVSVPWFGSEAIARTQNTYILLNKIVESI
jgi:hypothetical protein